MIQQSRRDIQHAPLLVIIILFVTAKIPQLTLPHYWDEAWSYATAVERMFEEKATLFPGVVDVDATRGHPLFFYACATVWMKVFGNSLLGKHCFALFISVLLLTAVYSICLRLFNYRVAIVATVLLCVQILFFVQSSMLLPEILVALLAFVSIYLFAIKKHLLTAVSLACLLLTKESGLVLMLVMGIYFLWELTTKIPRSEKWKRFFSLCIPTLLIVSFFVAQKIIYGWFFYPEHIGYINLSLGSVMTKIWASFLAIFFGEERRWLWLLLLVFGGFLFLKNKKLFVQKQAVYAQTFILLSVAYCVVYFIFCAVNFYTLRYLMPNLVFSIVYFAVLLDIFLTSLSLKFYVVFSLIVCVLTIWDFSTNDDTGDVGLGSYNVIKMQQETVDYLAQNHLQKAAISCSPFLQRVNLTNRACGFLNQDEAVFENVKWDIDSTTEYVLFDSMEPDYRYTEIAENANYRVVFSTAHEKVWAKIFKRAK